ncbi:Macrolide export protein MacA [Anatilimnocola aggregata]|uniref:Macrolide export protein MacA n=1 Tax=Anatilimnocola aggregata TaxID=2528021 RepID=A0A517Y702_9BACT|nr:efflux RND transporter periplasmic adaptor subunit [Anatilimnocola aggregata]QDU26018.1 Macrolide export protein MacA [Anatilimnocola aggregata]
MSGGNPAVLDPSTGDGTANGENLEDRVRSLRLSSIPQGGDWFRSLVLLVVGAGFLGILFYLVRETLEANRGAAAPGAVATTAAENNSSPEQPTSNGSEAGSNNGAANVPAALSRPGTTALESQGYIIPAHQILVSPQVSGRIIELHIEEGRRVDKGAILARLENTEYQADVDRAKSTVRAASERLRELENGSRPEEIAQAKAELGESQAQLSQLRSQWERNSELRKTNAITQQDLEQSESAYRAMEMRIVRLTQSFRLMELGPRDEQIENARALLEQAKAELTKAEWRLGNCIIKAPISGTILKKNAEEGNIVNPIAFNGSFSLCDMADLSDLEVDLNVQERDISTVFKGQKCRVRSLAYPERIYEGYVSRLMPIADRAKGAVPVRVKLSIPPEEEGVYLKPEMGATVTFLKAEAAPTAAPPQ